MTAPSRIAAVLLAFLVAGAATAAGPRKLTKTELKRYRTVMAEAVKAAKQGNHAAAVAAYDRALAIKPNDQAALTDQGWSAFLLKSFDRAEAITRRAIAAEGDSRRKAAAHYNLGRILEQRADRTGAIAAYLQSLKHRPSRTVREQLATLDPVAAANADPLKPQPMAGPFARFEDFCKTPGARKPCPLSDKGEPVTTLVAPYHEVRWFQAGENDGTCHLALKLAAGWFVDAQGTPCPDDAESDTEIEGFALTDLAPGGHQEVVLKSSVQYYEVSVWQEGGRGTHRLPKYCEAHMVACGVPAQGKPTCLRLVYAGTDECRLGRAGTWAWELWPVFTPDGMLELKAEGAPDGDARAQMGRRPLTFP